MQRRRQTPLRQQDDLSLRRLRLISDIMEDYQDNMRRAMRYLEMELAMNTAGDLDELNHRANNYTHNTSESVREWYRNQQRDRDGLDRRDQYGFDTIRQRERERHRPRYDPFRTIFQNNPIRFRHFDYQDSDTMRGYTNEEIGQVTETIPYTESMGDLRCPITWDTISPGQEVVRLRGCGHMFSNAGIREWFQRNRRCPVCRSYPARVTETELDLSSQQPPANTYTFSTTMFLDPSGIDLPLSSTTQFQFADETPAISHSIEPVPPNTSSSQPSSNRTSTTPINSLLDGIIGALTDAVTENRDGAYFEREFTFNLNDILGSQLASSRNLRQNGNT